MTAFDALWVPILVSSVIVFIVSSAIHMLPLWHKGEYPAVPQEDRVMDALRPMAIPPGEYMVPRAASMKEMQAPAFVEKMSKGPVMILTVMRSGRTGMTRELVLWFVYVLVVSLLTAYVASRALAPGADYMQVFRMASVVAFTGYVLALWQMWIWYRRSLGTTLAATLDGLIYGLLTGGVFGWLWPG